MLLARYKNVRYILINSMISYIHKLGYSALIADSRERPSRKRKGILISGKKLTLIDFFREIISMVHIKYSSANEMS
jgi:hypothetical protein